MTDDPEREARLAELLAELENRDQPDAAAQLGAEDIDAEEYARLRDLAAALDQAGAAGRAEQASALAEPPSAGDLALARTAHTAQATRQRPTASRQIWRWGGTLAAAAIIVTLTILATRGDPALPDIVMGPDEVVLECEPGYARFRWSVPGVYHAFRVAVYHSEDDLDLGAELLGSQTLRGPEAGISIDTERTTGSWTPSHDQIRQLRSEAEILWTLEARRGADMPRVFEAKASR